jgi:hypothetical protein
LGSIARVAAPLVATAVGGPGAGMLVRGAIRALGEGEGEEELELEYEGGMEAEGPITHHEALAEALASMAAQAESEAEAEAMVGASTATVLTARDRAALRSVLPHLVRGVAVLTRLLRRRRTTRPAVRALPTILRRTAQILRRTALAGRPVTRTTAARVLANQTRRVLGSPRTCAAAIVRNIRGARLASRRVRRRV